MNKTADEGKLIKMQLKNRDLTSIPKSDTVSLSNIDTITKQECIDILRLLSGFKHKLEGFAKKL